MTCFIKSSVLTSVLLFSILAACLAQQSGMYFKHLTRDDGLPSNNVNAITQDDKGFIWFGTEEGLSRYDGYSFRNFTHSKTNSNSLSNNHIDCMVKDDKGNFWIGTRKGLNYFDVSTYIIHRVPNEFMNSLGTVSIEFLLFASNGNLYIGTINNALFVLDTKTNAVSHFVHEQNNPNSLISNDFTGFYEDIDKNIWIGTTHGLDLLDSSSGNFKHYLTNKQVRAVVQDRNDSLFVSVSGDDCWYYRTKGGFVKKKVNMLGLEKTTSVKVLIDSKGNQWTTIRDVGLYYDDYINDKRDFIQFDRANRNGINSNAIYTIFEDREGNVWLGTSDRGVNLLDVNKKPFILVRDNYLSSGLRNNNVRTIFQDSENEIWIGTKIGGTLSRFDRESFIFKHYEHNPLDPSSLSDDFIFCIAEENPNYLWIGTMRGGVNLFNKRTGKCTSFTFKQGKSNGLSSNFISTLYKNLHNQLWIGHIENGIDVFNTQTRMFKHYESTVEVSSISSNNIKVIYEDRSANLWIGTWFGLNLYNKQDDNFTRFVNNPNSSQSISNNQVICVYEDSNNKLWVGTKGGLNLLNRSDFTFKSYTKDDGLPNDVIAGIAEDKEGNLWLSTNMGLSKFNPTSKTFINYTKEDGLQGNEFAKYVYCRTQSGELMFGGNNGFNIFDPEAILDHKIVPEICLTNLKLFNQTVSVNQMHSPLKKHISQTDTLVLNYKQNEITIQYVALNYSSSSRVHYAYTMEGYDKDWNDVGSKREAIYTNLAPGQYVFRVKASNNNGVWSDDSTSLHVTILPPLWLTWWAYVIYVGIFFTLVYGFRCIVVYKVQKQKEHELDQQKLKFFIDVSHEIRTPISLILNPAYKIIQQDSNPESLKAATSIYQSAQKITNLVNQLLDFRKLEQGQMPLAVVNADIVAFTKQIVALLVGLADMKNITLLIKSQNHSIQAWFDPDKYEKIVNNLLSNAIKFTPTNGTIIVGLDTAHIPYRYGRLGKLFRISNSNSFVNLTVEDTGVGIKKNQLVHIFNRFYRSDETVVGTGIGLNYVKSLVELHKGTIRVSSKYGLGSTFTVCLPLGKNNFSQKQLVNDEFELTKYNYNVCNRESLRYEMGTKDMDEDKIEPKLAGDHKVQILIVEDNKRLRDQLVNELNEQYAVIQAVNGMDGWEKAEKYFPDIIISDVMMPKMDGIQLCRKIKTDEVMCHIPVILLTAKCLIENRIEGFESAADDYMSKPFSVRELIVRIENILESRNKLKKKFSALNFLFESDASIPTNKEEAFLDEITKIALKNINDPDFSYKDLIRISGYSQTAFYRKISALTDMTPGYFLHSIKIKYAAELLLKQDLTVKEISFKLGYNSPSYFNKYFLKVLGKTPLEFLNNHRQC